MRERFAIAVGVGSEEDVNEVREACSEESERFRIEVNKERRRDVFEMW